MPVIAPVLVDLIISKVAANIKFLAGKSPMESPMPMYFKQFCTAIGMGIANGVPTLKFETGDIGFMGAPPIPALMGIGNGIEVDAGYMSQKMYTTIRNKIIQKYGQTSHKEWPPPKGNSGEYLKAFTDGISEAVKEHYKVCWILMSTHNDIYAGAGTIDPRINKTFKGVEADSVKSLILSSKGMLIGDFLPDFAEAVAISLKDTIENHSKGKVVIIGICVLNLSQICDIPGIGVGSGTAT